MTALLAAYLATTLALAPSVWHVTGRLGQPQWIRVTLALIGPVVVAHAITRRLTRGHW